MHPHAVAVHLGTGHLGARVDLEPLLAEDLVGFLHQILIVAGENRGQEFDDRDLGTQAAPHRAELEADHTAADDHQMLGHFRNRQRAHVRQYTPLVELQERQLHRHGARGDDHRRALPVRDRAVGRYHFHHVARLQRAVALGPRDLVLLEQELDALGVLGHDVGFASHHRRQVDRGAVDLDPVFGRMQAQPFVVFGALEECLRRNAPYIHARSAQRLVEFDAGDGEAELCRANRGDIAAGAAAKHHDVGSLKSRGGHAGKLIPRESFVGSATLPASPLAPAASQVHCAQQAGRGRWRDDTPDGASLSTTARNSRSHQTVQHLNRWPRLQSSH